MSITAYSYGGTFATTLDGVDKSWGLTFITPTAGLAIIEHEMGHAFRLEHSSSTISVTGDYWDVMGACAGMNPVEDPIYGQIGIHTIAQNKSLLGWIRADQILEISQGEVKRVNLGQIALPQSTDVMMIKIPINGSPTNFYTIEARRPVGYDFGVMEQAIVIHHVNTTNIIPQVIVIDRDGNPFTFDDQGWVPGQVFNDSLNEIKVCVNSATDNGMDVTVGLGVSEDCTFSPNLSPSSVQADPVRTYPGEKVRFTIRIINYGLPANGVVISSTIPNGATYVPGSATTTQGSVMGTNPLTFDIGTIGYFNMRGSGVVTITYDVMIDADILASVILSGPIVAQWDGGSQSLTSMVFVNGEAIYLPIIER